MHEQPMGDLINKAKGELEEIGDKKIPSLEVDKHSSELPPHTKALKDRLDPRPLAVEHDKRGEKASLDSFRWELVTNDGVTEESPPPPHVLDVLNESTKEASAAVAPSLMQRAESWLDKPGGVFLRKHVLLNLDYVRGNTGNGMSEEEQALIVLLGESGFARQDSDANTVIQIAVNALRTRTGERPAWSGISSSTKEGAAVKILAELKQTLHTVEDKDIDACVITALACGDPIAAIDLAIQGDPYALSRLSTRPGRGRPSTFDTAIALYPDAVREAVDLRLSTLGKGDRKALMDNGHVKSLVQQAEARIHERLVAKRNEWYRNQKIADTQSPTDVLQTEGLKAMCESAATNGTDFSSIEMTISDASNRLANAQVANAVSAELVRRLSPELALGYATTALQDQASGKAGVIVRNYLPHNENGQVYEESSKGAVVTRMTAEEKREAVQKVPMTNNETVQREFDYRGGQRMKTLITFLKNPAYFCQDVNQRTKELIGDAHTSTRRKNLAFGLIRAVQYLQAVAENPAIHAIVNEQFQLGDMISSEKLEVAQQTLQNTFKDVIDTGSQLTLYDTAVAEGQLEMDIEGVQLLASARQRKAAELVSGKTGEIKALIAAEISTVTAELQELHARKIKMEQLQEEKTSAEGRMQELTVQLTEIGAWAVNKNELVRRGSRKIGIVLYSPAEQSAALTRTHTAISAAEAEFRTIEVDIASTTPVTDEQIQRASERAGALSRLAQQAHLSVSETVG